jgi:Type II CAAX prenyl endopeptidase Rce1-like
VSAYTAAVTFVWGISCFAIAAQVYTRWFVARAVSFPIVYCTLLLGIFVFGAVTVGLRASPRVWDAAGVLSIAAGTAGGLLAWSADTRIRRLALARQRHSAEAVFGRVATYRAPQARQTPASTSQRRRMLGYRRGLENRDALLSCWEWGIGVTISVGALEEMVHKGPVLRLVDGTVTSGWPRGIAYAGLILIFAFSHVWFGLMSVIAKLPLGMITMVVAIAFNSLVPAVIAHAIFNALTALAIRADGVRMGFHVPERSRNANVL